MIPGAAAAAPTQKLRWTPARLIVLGAALALGPLVLDATVSLDSSLAFLSGTLTGLPFWFFLLDVALAGLLVPVGVFLALCGVLLSVRQLRPRGISLGFRAGLGGAGMNLASGLILGLLNLSGYLLPLELLTVDFVRSEVIVAFVAAVGAAVGTFLVFCGIALLVREAPVAQPRRRGARVRVPRGKSIYQRAPSAR